MNSEISGSEKVQEWAPDAKVVKSFTIYGFENFIDSNFPNYTVKPIMMIAGNNEQAKLEVTKIITDLGFETLDTGNLDQALHLEHMTLLWVKMVRRDGPVSYTHLDVYKRQHQEKASKLCKDLNDGLVNIINSYANSDVKIYKIDGAKTVSYTHLDVYKRQAFLPRSVILYSVLGGTSGKISFIIKPSSINSFKLLDSILLEICLILFYSSVYRHALSFNCQSIGIL